MHQDYRLLPLDDLELLEKQTLRMIVQALQQYSGEAKRIFDNAPPKGTEVIVLAEDLTQYALEVAEIYPIDRRFAGFIDYKRSRWFPTSAGLIPQVLLADAKASKENNRDTLQASQLPMDADFNVTVDGVTTAHHLDAGVPQHMEIPSAGGVLHAVTTSIFVHMYYRDVSKIQEPYRDLKDIYVLAVPHGRLKDKYNPNASTGFWGKGKHSDARQEDPRIRVYFDRLRQACPWRLQQLTYAGSTDGFTQAIWRDVDASGFETNEPFLYLPRPIQGEA
ncbi:hypothetical protein GCM10027261_14260 [Geodermatophilus arenarius]|uniref:SfiI family type II restriction endonuclease n=1 Tax=Geodermatophilus arenarius TaxID=1137990 RepID=A0ABV9LHS2_9ACTN